jgi:hypothetical protein
MPATKTCSARQMGLRARTSGGLSTHGFASRPSDGMDLRLRQQLQHVIRSERLSMPGKRTIAIAVSRHSPSCAKLDVSPEQAGEGSLSGASHDCMARDALLSIKTGRPNRNLGRQRPMAAPKRLLRGSIECDPRFALTRTRSLAGSAVGVQSLPRRRLLDHPRRRGNRQLISLCSRLSE